MNISLEEILNRLEFIGTIAGILLGSLILVASLLNLTQQIYVGLSILVICVFNLVLRGGFIENPEPHSNNARRVSHSNIMFTVVYLLSLFFFIINIYSRELIYFTLLGLAAVIIFNDILITKISNIDILIKIALLGINIRYGFYYIFPSIAGYDAYFHSLIIDNISSNGAITPIEISQTYFFYPLFHIYVSLNKIFLNISLKDTIFISLGIVSMIISLLLFLLIKKISNEKIALLSILLFNITNTNIDAYIGNITAMSYLLILFSILLYLSFIKNNNKSNMLIIVGITLISIITHQLTTFVILLIFSLLYATNLIYTKFLGLKKININLYHIIFSAIFTYAYWNITYVDTNNLSFFEYVFQPLIKTVLFDIKYDFSILTSGKLLQQYNPIDYFILQITYLILPITAIGGSFIWLRSKDLKKISLCLTFLVIFAFIYFIPLIGYRNLLTDRWLPILYIFVMPLSSVYLFNLYLRFINKNVGDVILNLIIFTICLLMITSPIINKDNAFISKDTAIRTQLKLSEIGAINVVDNFFKGEITMDYAFYNGYQFYSYIHNSSNYNKNIILFFDSNFTKSGNSQYDNSLIFFRGSLLKEPTLLYDQSKDFVVYTPTIMFDSVMFTSLNTQNKLYSGNNIFFYRNIGY